ncbi:MAG TPA: heme exporter protein CcmB [Candidatus Thermoplasmatota archaeon]|nr:heme exporter protein CcmB [Candidatus Thermoplasmatota archaeon]
MSFTALLWKDVRREARGKESVQAALVLVALFLLVDLFAFSSLAEEPRLAAAVLWAPLVFAAAALVSRGFASEADKGTLALLRSAPVPVAWHGWSRTVVHLALVALVALATLALASALFAFPVSAVLAATVALAVPGIAVAGTLASALAAQARMRDALLPVLLVPVLAPLLQAGIEATRLALGDATFAEARPALLLMLAYDLVAFGVAWLLWPVVLDGE